MSTDLSKPTAQELQIKSELDAWKKYMLSPNELIFFGGDEVPVSAVSALLAGELGRHTRARQLELEHRTAVQLRNSKIKDDRKLHRTLESFVRTRLAKEPGALAAFGCVDVVPKPPSTETMAIANANKLKTRLKRGTMGKRQKEAITTTPQPTLVIVDPKP